jgi:prevent-host-death family protein
MKVVNTHQAKTTLSRLLDEAAAGHEIIIAKAGKPVARLIAIESARKPRILGALAGKIVESADCWESDSEMDQSIAAPLVDDPVRNFSSKVAEDPTPYGK